MTTDNPTPQLAGPCCGWEVNRDYIVSVDNDTLKCPDCGKEYKRSEHQALKAVAQPAGEGGAPDSLIFDTEEIGCKCGPVGQDRRRERTTMWCHVAASVIE